MQKTAYETGLGIPAEPLSDLEQESEGILQSPAYHKRKPQRSDEHRSEERRVGKSVDLGGRRIIKKKKKNKKKKKELIIKSAKRREKNVLVVRCILYLVAR